jgi:hypothetical protein
VHVSAGLPRDSIVVVHVPLYVMLEVLAPVLISKPSEKA